MAGLVRYGDSKGGSIPAPCGLFGVRGVLRLSLEVAFSAEAMTGESPLWDSQSQSLLWVDIQRGHLHSFDPASGGDAVVDLGQQVGTVVPAHPSGWLVGLADGLYLLDDLAGATPRLVHPLESELPANRCNDGACDPAGRLWMGTMSLERTPGAGSLYRLESTSSGLWCERVLDGLTISNGLDWSPDGKRMYFIDSSSPQIDVFDFDLETGALSNRQLFASVGSDVMPDGMTVDAEGQVWVAIYGAGQVRCYTLEGRLCGIVQLPVSSPTSCAFGGRNLTDLYITSASWRLSEEEKARQILAGSLFVVPGAGHGLEENRFQLQDRVGGVAIR